MRSFVVFPLALVVILAGCLGGDSEDPDSPGEDLPGNGNGQDNETRDPDGNGTGEDEGNKTDNGPSGRSLDDLVCEYVYPDGQTPVPCENQFTEVQAEDADRPSLTDGLLCIHDNAETEIVFSIYWDPVGDVYSLYYDSGGLEGGVNALFYTRSGEEPDGNILANWYDGPSAGLVTLPEGEIEQSQQFVLRFYTHSLSSDTPGLQDGTIRAYWSLHENMPYPLQAVESADGPYYFNEVEVEDHVTYPYSLQGFEEQGDDFNITVEADHVQNFRETFNHTPHTPATSPCAV